MYHGLSWYVYIVHWWCIYHMSISRHWWCVHITLHLRGRDTVLVEATYFAYKKDSGGTYWTDMNWWSLALEIITRNLKVLGSFLLKAAQGSTGRSTSFSMQDLAPRGSVPKEEQSLRFQSPMIDCKLIHQYWVDKSRFSWLILFFGRNNCVIGAGTASKRSSLHQL